MQHTYSPAANTPAESSSSARAIDFALVPVIGALVLGLVILFGVGFANMEVAHNAAHDARHAFAFPCH